MNTVTTHETHALEAAAPAQNLILVPLLQLCPSKRNVRKTVGASITVEQEAVESETPEDAATEAAEDEAHALAA
ncbi:MAG: hypothetical protein ACYCSR_16730 [Thiomonas sp.]